MSVKKILFDTTELKPRATGVEAISEGEDFTVNGEEIILAAGAIASPQILMLSGIGPKEHLEEHNINTLIDSPGVGQNLRDHPLIAITWQTKPGVILSNPNMNPRGQVTLRYTADGSPINNDMIVYLFAGASKRRDLGGISTEPIGIGAGLGLNLALSQGEIKLQSNDYRDYPLLNYNLLDDPEDMRRYRDGVRILVGLEKHPSISEFVETRLYPLDSDMETNDTLDSWIRKHVQTGHHVSCTAKMGLVSDPMAVVDQYGKVYGTDGLRVADASVMPDCVRANINVTVMVIGERIADFIKQGL